MVLVHSHGAAAAVRASFGVRPTPKATRDAKSGGGGGGGGGGGDGDDQVIVVTTDEYVSVYDGSLSARAAGTELPCLKTWSLAVKGSKKLASSRKLVGCAVLVPGTTGALCLAEKGVLLSWDYFSDALTTDGAVRVGAAGAAAQDAGAPVALLVAPRLEGVAVVVLRGGQVLLRCAKGEMVADADFGGDDGFVVHSADIAEVNRKKRHWRVVLTETKDESAEARVRFVEVIGSSLVAGASYAVSRSNHLDGLDAIGTIVDAALAAAVVHNGQLVTLLWSDGISQVVFLPRGGMAQVTSEMDVSLGDQPQKTPAREVSRKRGRKPAASASKACLVPSAAVRADGPVLLLSRGAGLVAWDAQLGVELAKLSEESALPAAVVSLACDRHMSSVVACLANGQVHVEDCSPQSECGLAAASAESTLAGALELALDGGGDFDGDDGAVCGCATVVDDLGDPATFSAQGFKRKIAAAESAADKALATLASKRAKRADKDKAVSVLGNSAAAVGRATSAALEARDWVALECLLARGAVSLTAAPALLDGLAAQGQLQLLYRCLTCVTDLDEAAVVGLVRFVALQCPTKELEAFATWFEAELGADVEASDADGSEGEGIKDSNKGDKKDAKSWRTQMRSRLVAERQARLQRRQRRMAAARTLCGSFAALPPAARAQQYFLMGLMCVPRNELFFVHACRRLDASTIKLLVRAVATVVLHYSSLPAKAPVERSLRARSRTKPGAQTPVVVVPTFEQSLDLMTAVLDAAFRTVTAVPDKRTSKLLKAVLGVISAHTQVCQGLSAAKVPLECAMRMGDVGPVKAISGYQVETITL